MGPRLVRIAAAAAERLADQGAARENARIAATHLAQGRVDRLEVENYLAQHVRSHPLRQRVQDPSGSRHGAAR